MLEFVCALLAAGASVDVCDIGSPPPPPPPPPPPADEAAAEFCSPLRRANENGHVAVAVELFERGAGRARRGAARRAATAERCAEIDAMSDVHVSWSRSAATPTARGRRSARARAPQAVRRALAAGALPPHGRRHRRVAQPPNATPDGEIAAAAAAAAAHLLVERIETNGGVRRVRLGSHARRHADKRPARAVSRRSAAGRPRAAAAAAAAAVDSAMLVCGGDVLVRRPALRARACDATTTMTTMTTIER